MAQYGPGMKSQGAALRGKPLKNLEAVQRSACDQRIRSRILMTSYVVRGPRSATGVRLSGR